MEKGRPANKQSTECFSGPIKFRTSGFFFQKKVRNFLEFGLNRKLIFSAHVDKNG